MKIETPAKRVTIYVNSSDHSHGRPLHQTIIQHCLAQGIAGATATRAIEGYGAGQQLHKPSLLGLGENLPIRIEIIDIPERIDALLPTLHGMIGEGLITVSDVHSIRYLPDPTS